MRISLDMMEGRVQELEETGLQLSKALLKSWILINHIYADMFVKENVMKMKTTSYIAFARDRTIYLYQMLHNQAEI